MVDIDNLKFLLISNFYDYNNGATVLRKSSRITPTPKHTTMKYNLFRLHFGKVFLIWNIESENYKADTFTKGLQG